jgi:hypothetical protein
VSTIGVGVMEPSRRAAPMWDGRISRHGCWPRPHPRRQGGR